MFGRTIKNVEKSWGKTTEKMAKCIIIKICILLISVMKLSFVTFGLWFKHRHFYLIQILIFDI